VQPGRVGPARDRDAQQLRLRLAHGPACRMAGQDGGSGWRVRMAGQDGGSGWRVSVAGQRAAYPGALCGTGEVREGAQRDLCSCAAATCAASVRVQGRGAGTG
jgi:hypothetical protein